MCASCGSECERGSLKMGRKRALCTDRPACPDPKKGRERCARLEAGGEINGCRREQARGADTYVPGPDARAGQAGARGRRGAVDDSVVKVVQDAVKGNRAGAANVARVAEEVGHLGAPRPRRLLAPVARVKGNLAARFFRGERDGVARLLVQLVRGEIPPTGIAKVCLDHIVPPLRVGERVQLPVRGRAGPGAAALKTSACDGFDIGVYTSLQPLGVNVCGEVSESVREHLLIRLHDVRDGVASAQWHDALLHQHVPANGGVYGREITPCAQAAATCTIACITHS